MSIKPLPCPVCGCAVIEVKLEMDCYSSWAHVECPGCFAYSECGTDPPESTCPAPTKDWKEKGIRMWNKTVFMKETRVIHRKKAL